MDVGPLDTNQSCEQGVGYSSTDDRKKLLTHPIIAACMQEAFFARPERMRVGFAKKLSVDPSILSADRQRVLPFRSSLLAPDQNEVIVQRMSD